MTSGGLIAFLGVAILLIVTPGQDMALVLRNTMSGGRRAGIFTSFGVVSGLVIWATVASVGLAALLESSQVLFGALKIAGALYLALLGLHTLRAAFRPESGPVGHAQRGIRSAIGDRAALQQGLISNLGNPKIAVFFSSLLPQFIESGESRFLPVLALGLTFCLLTLCWLVAYAALLDRAGAFMRRSQVRRTIEAITGVALIGLAIRLATEQR